MGVTYTGPWLVPVWRASSPRTRRCRLASCLLETPNLDSKLQIVWPQGWQIRSTNRSSPDPLKISRHLMLEAWQVCFLNNKMNYSVIVLYASSCENKNIRNPLRKTIVLLERKKMFHLYGPMIPSEKYQRGFLMDITRPLFVNFKQFNTKNVDLSGIRTQIVRVEGKHSDLDDHHGTQPILLHR